MDPKEQTFWLETLAAPMPSRRTPPPASVDVAVIGGGYTGLAAARLLAQHGASVAVLERETIGWGASTRNGGMVLTGLKLSADALVHTFGRERARQLFAASLEAIDCVEALVTSEGIPCDFLRCGHLEVAAKPGHMASLDAQAAFMAREFGHPTQIISRADLHTEIGSSRYYGGLVDPASAGLNPARYLAGLADAAARAGATLHEGAPVTALRRTAQGFTLQTPHGPLQARDVFVATNGYTGAITPALQRRIIPIGSYIIVTEPLPEALAHEISPRDRMIFDTKNFLFYFRLTPDRRLLFGGRASFLPATPTTVRESAEILRRGMIEVYPQLRQVSVEYAWGGTLGFPFDILPHAGRMDGLYFALGYAGHGVAMATLLGTRMAEIILGQPDRNPFAGLPFPTAPLGLYRGNPWFLPLAGLWYRLLDFIS